MKKSILVVWLLSALIASNALAADAVSSNTPDNAPVAKKEEAKLHKKKKPGTNNQVHSKKKAHKMETEKSK